MSKVNFKALEKSELKDYRHLILNQVYEEIDSVDDMEEAGYVVIAAFSDKDKLGAVCGFLDDLTGDIELLSIYVVIEARRLKIGTALMQRLFLAAGESYDISGPDEVSLNCVYSPEGEYVEGFEGFLKSLGNARIDFLPALYLVNSDSLKENKIFKRAFSESFNNPEFFTGESFHENFWDSFCIYLDAYPDRELSYFYGDRLEPLAMVLIEEEGPGQYRLNDMNADPEVAKRTFEELFMCALSNLSRNNPDGFDLLVEESDRDNWLYKELIKLAYDELRFKSAAMDLKLIPKREA